MLVLGGKATPFTLQDQHGKEVSWEQFRGSPVVVFFYPKASTPGCTTEACDFRDKSAEFAARGVKIVGVSADPVKKQVAFATKYELQMPLLADTERSVLEPWGVWREKTMCGKTTLGIVRSTFLFDEEGRLEHRWDEVKVKGHVEAVLARIDQRRA